MRRQRDDAVHRLVNALGRPFLRIWLASAEMSAPWLPRPENPHGGADGVAVDSPAPSHDADRLLLVGNGAAVGYGVLSHDLALPGHLGRQLTAATGRATHVTVIADGSMTWGSALGVLREANLESFDAVMLTVGVNEALGLSSAAQLERASAGVLDYLASPAAPKLTTFVVGVPPLKSISLTPRFVEWLVDGHSAVINERLRSACAGRERVVFIPFAPTANRDIRRYRSTETYRDWAGLLVPAAAAGLARECPTDDQPRHSSD
jgi:hypothetical protein